MAVVASDWRTFPGIPELASLAVQDCVKREADPEAHAAACAFLQQYMGEVNSEPGGHPEPLSYYGQALAGFDEGFRAARRLYQRA